MKELDFDQPATLRWYNIPSDNGIDRGFTMAFDTVDQAIRFYHDKLTAEQRRFASITTAGYYLTHQEIDQLQG